MNEIMKEVLDITGPWTGDWSGHDATLEWREPIGDEIPGYWVVDVGDHGKWPVADCIAHALIEKHLRERLEKGGCGVSGVPGRMPPYVVADSNQDRIAYGPNYLETLYRATIALDRSTT